MDDIPNAPISYLEVSFDVSSEPVPNRVSTVENNAQLPFAVSEVYWAPVISADCITEGEDVKTVYDLVLDMKDFKFELIPGDTVGISPNNEREEVEHLLERLGVLNKIDAVCEICVQLETTKKNAKVPSYIPARTTLRHVFETCLDLHAVPKKLFIRALLDYTSDLKDQTSLQSLCSRKSERYTDWVSSEHSCIASLLDDHPSCQPPISLMLEHLPRLLPRPYSIAFFSGESRKNMHIAFTLVTYFSGGSRRTGVCSGWLERITQGFRSTSSNELSLCTQMGDLSIEAKSAGVVQIPLYLRKSSGFHAPQDISRPLIMIGPGVGVAPFVGFLQQREQRRKNLECTNAGPCWLLFGCRYMNRDMLYSDEIQRQVTVGTLDHYILAHSRERGSQKFVQDNIRMYFRDLCHILLDGDGSVFVCGDAHNMARDVLSVIVDSIAKYKGINKADAQKIVLELQEKGRYKEDVWTIQDDVVRMYSKVMADQKKRQAIGSIPPQGSRRHGCDMV